MPKTAGKPSLAHVGDALRKARASITKHGNIRVGLARYKQHASHADLVKVLPDLLQHSAYNRLLTQNNFPVSYERIGFGSGIPGLASLQNELIWASQLFLHEVAKLRSFIAAASAYDNAYLTGDRNTIEQHLIGIEAEFGVSLWTIENRINFLRRFDGFQAQRKYSRLLSENNNASPVIQYFINWASYRVETSTNQDDFFNLLDDVEPAESSGGISTLLNLSFGNVRLISESQAASVIAYSDAFSLVDRYRFLKCVLHSAINSFPQKFYSNSAILSQLSTLSSTFNDPEIARILVLSGFEGEQLNPDYSLIYILDAYSSGNYENCIDSCRSFLLSKLSIEVIYIYLKCHIHIEIEPDISLIAPDNSLLLSVANDLNSLLRFDESSGDAYIRLSKLVCLYNSQSWASALSQILDRQKNDERLYDPTLKQICSALRSPFENPISILTLQAVDLLSNFEKQFVGNQPDSLTVIKFSTMRRRLSIESEEFAEIKGHMNGRDRAILCFRRNELGPARDHALQSFESATSNSHYAEAGQLLSEIFLRLERWEECADIIVRLFLKSDHFAQILPLHTLIKSVARQADMAQAPDPNLYGKLPVVIAFDIFSRHVSDQYDANRADAFKDLLSANGVQHASDLAATPLSPRSQFIHFLRFVCVPEVLDQSLALSSTREVEDERARILVLLTEMFLAESEPVPSEFMEELRAIRTRQVVRDTNLQLDQSRIYVNVEGIRKAATAHIRENWQRYRLISTQNDEESFHKLKKVIENALGEKLTFFTLSMPATERYQAFTKIFMEIREMFISSKEFGLDANLSTNIRHGFTMREIRGPLVARHLITNRDTEAGKYHSNSYWKERTSFSSDEAWVSVDAALSTFSQSMDNLIDDLNRNLLRIKSEQSPNGLFDFSILEFEIRAIQDGADHIETFDGFFDLVIDYLWQTTGASLETVRIALADRFLQDVQLNIATLQESLRKLEDIADHSALIAATNLVRPDMQSAIERVANWFKLSANDEYADYSLEIAFEAGLATVKSYFSDLIFRPKYDSSMEAMMAGSTLPHFARLFSLLIENAAMHSGIITGELPLHATVHLEGTILAVSLSNALSPEKDLAEVATRAHDLNEQFSRDEALEAVRQEGGSGYAKIWKVIRYDLRLDPQIEVSITSQNKFEFFMMMDVARILS